ncbi:MAG TPA: hypothetical protein EYP07_17260, partial [Kiloniellaceae bacterium]|nr:hypothetical protein [Kiloniellaceae bacterium]
MAGQRNGADTDANTDCSLRLSANFPCDLFPADLPLDGRSRRLIGLEAFTFLDGEGLRPSNDRTRYPADAAAAQSAGGGRDAVIRDRQLSPELGSLEVQREPEPAVREDAEGCFARGLARAESGDHQGAVVEFSAALAC